MWIAISGAISAGMRWWSRVRMDKKCPPIKQSSKNQHANWLYLFFACILDTQERIFHTQFALITVPVRMTYIKYFIVCQGGSNFLHLGHHNILQLSTSFGASFFHSIHPSSILSFSFYVCSWGNLAIFALKLLN